MVKIKKQLVLSRAYVSSGTNPRRYITVHQTGNTSRGANAQAHANLQSNGNARNASWHYQVDDKQAIQSYPDTARCWHAGDGTGHGNQSSIAIEICVNSDGDYVKAVKNAASLVKKLQKKYNIPNGNIVQHNHWSGKNCPAQIRAGKDRINWTQFKGLVSGSKTAKQVANQSKNTSKKTAKTNSKNLKADGYWGKATTRRLQQVMGTVADGEVWGQNSQWKASNPGLTSGWKWVPTARVKSSPVIAALQRKLGVAADGLIGPATIRALQRRVGGHADGVLWKKSPAIKQLQRRLNKGKI